MVQDMEKLHQEVDALENALLNKTNALKLAETRLENRLQRPGAECCRDEAAFGLENEVTQLRATRSNLRAKIDSAKSVFNILFYSNIVPYLCKMHIIVAPRRFCTYKRRLFCEFIYGSVEPFHISRLLPHTHTSQT